MSRRSAERGNAPVNIFPLRTDVPGFGGHQFLTAFNAYNFVDRAAHLSGAGGSLTISNATADVSFGYVSLASGSGYNSDFVTRILAADVAEPEASFNNVVDMLDWLNRD
jgi:hypothetical protein